MPCPGEAAGSSPHRPPTEPDVSTRGAHSKSLLPLTPSSHQGHRKGSLTDRPGRTPEHQQYCSRGQKHNWPHLPLLHGHPTLLPLWPDPPAITPSLPDSPCACRYPPLK